MEKIKTQKDVTNHLNKIFNDLRDILVAKGEDYAGEDTFKSFKRTSEMVNVPVEKVILTRVGDKFSRLVTVLEKGNSSVNEKLDDTIQDCIGYLTLLSLWVSDDSSNDIVHANDGKSHKVILEDDDGYTD